jgi:hypothetical protein
MKKILSLITTPKERVTFAALDCASQTYVVFKTVFKDKMGPLVQRNIDSLDLANGIKAVLKGKRAPLVQKTIDSMDLTHEMYSNAKSFVTSDGYHKEVDPRYLTMESEFFETMLTIGMRETFEKEVALPIITRNALQALNNLSKYGETSVELADQQDFLIAADFCLFLDLEIAEGLTPANVTRFLQFAISRYSPKLLSQAYNFLLNNIEDVLDFGYLQEIEVELGAEGAQEVDTKPKTEGKTVIKAADIKAWPSLLQVESRIKALAILAVELGKINSTKIADLIMVRISKICNQAILTAETTTDAVKKVVDLLPLFWVGGLAPFPPARSQEYTSTFNDAVKMALAAPNAFSQAGKIRALVHAIIEAGDIEVAQRIAEMDSQRGWGLEQVAAVYLDRGDIAKVKELLSKINMPQRKAEAILVVFRKLMEQQQYEQAADIAGLLNPKEQAASLRFVEQQLTEAGQTEIVNHLK